MSEKVYKTEDNYPDPFKENGQMDEYGFEEHEQYTDADVPAEKEDIYEGMSKEEVDEYYSMRDNPYIYIRETATPNTFKAARDAGLEHDRDVLIYDDTDAEHEYKEFTVYKNNDARKTEAFERNMDNIPFDVRISDVWSEEIDASDERKGVVKRPAVSDEDLLSDENLESLSKVIEAEENGKQL